MAPITAQMYCYLTRTAISSVQSKLNALLPPEGIECIIHFVRAICHIGIRVHRKQAQALVVLVCPQTFVFSLRRSAVDRLQFYEERNRDLSNYYSNGYAIKQ